jgi:predicted  nucleic acid-binding Zn-ribbon protein
VEDSNRRDRDGWGNDSDSGSVLLASESLRRGSSAPPGLARPVKGEDRISMFWRVFGGTILSITALICITAYQQFTGTLTELRNNLNHLNESSRDLVKNDDFNTRLTSVWTTLKDMQAANATVAALKERSTLLEQQLKIVQEQMTAKTAAVSLSQKELETAVASLSAVKDRMTLLEQLVKSGEDERKELNKELQHLRERLAGVEGKQAAVPAVGGTGRPVK